MSGLALWLRRALPQHSRFRDYVIAVLAGLLALLLRGAIDPYASTEHLYFLSLMAVVFVAWHGGFGPGIATLALTLVGMIYFFVPPRNSLMIAELKDQIATVLFLVCGVGCAALGEAQRTSRARATSAGGSALGRKAELESEAAKPEKAEDFLQQSEVTLRAFYESAPVCMGVVELLDDDVLHLYDNAAGCRFHGVEPGATAGRLESQLGTQPDVLEHWLAKYRESAETGSATRFEYR
jgi:K+-sensing histidine kinase KdpD